MAGYLTWVICHHNKNTDVPPLIGCTVHVDILVRVNVWGPLPGLSGFTGNSSSAMNLVSTLRKIVDFTKADFIAKLVNAVA
ncbi:hypothetical protein N7453_005625 [Penicillium expansum]|nr:hypothetical protein N7453_005625 [Penicillium expansum]